MCRPVLSGLGWMHYLALSPHSTHPRSPVGRAQMQTLTPLCTHQPHRPQILRTVLPPYTPTPVRYLTGTGPSGESPRLSAPRTARRQAAGCQAAPHHWRLLRRHGLVGAWSHCRCFMANVGWYNQTLLVRCRILSPLRPGTDMCN